MNTKFQRASKACRWNENGHIETMENNVPRIDFDPMTGEKKGLLICDYVKNYPANPTFTDYENRVRNDYNSTIVKGSRAPDNESNMLLIQTRGSSPGIANGAVIPGESGGTNIMSVFVSYIKSERINFLAYGGIGLDENFYPFPEIGYDRSVIKVKENLYQIFVRYNRTGSGSDYIRSLRGNYSDGDDCFEIWGVNGYKSEIKRPDFLPNNGGPTEVHADILDLPYGDWVPRGKHTWKGEVFMPFDDREPTVLSHPDGRIYAKDGRLVLEGQGTLWQPDGVHGIDTKVPFYWTTQFSGKKNFTIGRDHGGANFWNGHIKNLFPFFNTIPESTIRADLGL